MNAFETTFLVAAQLAIAQGKFQRSNGRACSAAILDMACDVANGMHLLHYQGVTHGNLSSASILLTPSSSVRLFPSMLHRPCFEHCCFKWPILSLSTLVALLTYLLPGNGPKGKWL